MSDWLRPTWDFDDLTGTRSRLEQRLAEAADDVARAEVLTQLARVEGLQGDFATGEAHLTRAEEMASSHPVVEARIVLERGRLRRSSGHREESVRLFEEAFALAQGAGQDFLAVDAAHMVALAAREQSTRRRWTGRALDIARSSADGPTRAWLGTLYNNLAWDLADEGELEEALSFFRLAFAARAEQPGRDADREVARWAVGWTLLRLGRAQEALPLLERAVAWAEGAGRPDGWFHEELAAAYSAVGRPESAAHHARRALQLLPQADPSFADDAHRADTLHRISGAPGPGGGQTG